MTRPACPIRDPRRQRGATTVEHALVVAGAAATAAAAIAVYDLGPLFTGVVARLTALLP